jgi:hypothetical protein
MSERLLILRAPSGISGDMVVAGLVKLAGLDHEQLADFDERIGVEPLRGAIVVAPHSVANISGWQAKVSLGPEHSHRSYVEIRELIAASTLSRRAKDIAAKAFWELACAEGAVHRISPDEVTFHEVGALDSILDICLAAEVFDYIRPDRFICSPFPVCDGTIECAHGTLAAPAPAVLHMLKGIPVYGIDSVGETITPTALALLKAMEARFDRWPAVIIEAVVRVFGSRILPNVPNGAIFALGAAHHLVAESEFPER